MDMWYRQVGLRSGNTEQVVNLPDAPILKAGNAVTLKDSADPTRLWTILWVSDTLRRREHLNRKWSVGGMF